MKIYVRLLNEGTEVFRPVNAVRVTDDTYTLGDEWGYDPSDEEWEFPPGTTVRVETRELMEGVVPKKQLVAVEVVEQS